MLRQAMITRARHLTGDFASRIDCYQYRNPLLTLSSLYDPTNHPLQVRWKRRDGNKAFYELRKTTPKQMKKFRRRQAEIYHEKVGKHSPPNSKASARRQLLEERRQFYLNYDESKTPDELEYTLKQAAFEHLVGNTSQFSSTPTPEPLYLGHKYEYYLHVIKHQLKKFDKAMAEVGEVDVETLPDTVISKMPTDNVISLLVMSYRDKHGTRLKPVGVAKILGLLLQDLGLPVSSFGPKTYNSILTCCLNPTEARRIFKLMRDEQHTIPAEAWSVLVDIHAKLGDFKGCDAVMREMIIEGVRPKITTYTSLIAGCYKACISARMPSSVRAQASQLAWEKWKEMRIVGIDPDPMAYGAILRICAARGQAEKALSLLEEMRTLQVLPTTLCFSSALKAIARSHNSIVRYQNGSSIRYRRRQEVAAFHGKMTLEVLVAAEKSGAKIDDGFIANLILCAGAAGDSATAKAIFLAGELRKMDHLRTIGTDEHLKRLDSLAKGYNVDDETDALTALGISDTDSLVEQENEDLVMSHNEREYGKDSRVYSALMLACSQALDERGLGNMWEGRDNKGYLCENSLLMLTTAPEPNYFDSSIPGVAAATLSQSMFTDDVDRERDDMSKKYRRKKGEVMEFDPSGTTLDDIDPYLYQLYQDEDPALLRGNPDAAVEQLPADDPAWDVRGSERKSQVEEQNNKEKQSTEEWYFDINEKKWICRPAENVNKFASDQDAGSIVTEEFSEMDVLERLGKIHLDVDSGKITYSTNDNKNVTPENSNNSVTEEWVFDQKQMRWIVKTLPSEGSSLAIRQDDSSISHQLDFEEIADASITIKETDDVSEVGDMSMVPVHTPAVLDDIEYKMIELRKVLVGMPETRIHKIAKAFEDSLNYPSFLTLIPLLRENMPERVTTAWLLRKNIQNASVVFSKAREDNLIDVHMMNGMLQVECSSGRITRALACHEAQFQLNGIEPTQYSDRIVFQMLVEHHRIPRALEFKEKVERQGRTLDLLAYGSLIEYFAKHRYIGSAMMSLKECVHVHGSPPQEYSLNALRRLCRHQKLTDELGLEELIGPDPDAWKREGKAKFLYEYSKKDVIRF